MAHLKLENVTKTYGAHKALRGLSLDIADGEFFVLLGPTGAGKTTTLRLIAGLDKPTSGKISIGDEDVSGWSSAERDVALVFQYYSLYPRYTVRQNLAFPLPTSASIAPPRRCASRISSIARPTVSQAARCSVSLSAGPSSASRAHSSWTSPCPTSTPSFARRCAPS
jgi:multiple sugar transport system ATP-binding protein